MVTIPLIRKKKKKKRGEMTYKIFPPNCDKLSSPATNIFVLEPDSSHWYPLPSPSIFSTMADHAYVPLAWHDIYMDFHKIFTRRNCFSNDDHTYWPSDIQTEQYRSLILLPSSSSRQHTFKDLHHVASWGLLLGFLSSSLPQIHRSWSVHPAGTYVPFHKTNT